MLNIDDLRELWLLLAAFCMCDLPEFESDDVKNRCRFIMHYLEELGKDLE